MTGSPEAAAILARLDALQSDFGDMKSTMKTMSDSMAKLAVVEERQANAAQALERAFTEIDRIATRISKLEEERASNRQTKIWVDRVVVAVVGAAGMYAAKKLGLIS